MPAGPCTWRTASARWAPILAGGRKPAPGRREEAGAAFARARRIYDRCHDIRRIGAASIELCYTACGRLDAYLEHGLKPWDYAAGWLILEEAGGRLTTWDGKTPSLAAASCAILATNGRIHEELLALV